MAGLSMNHDEPHPGPAPLTLHPAAAESTPATGGDGGGSMRYLAPLLLLLAGPAVLALVILDAPPWLRAAPVLAYLGMIPGLAVVRLLRSPDRLMVTLLGVGLSLALGVLVAQLMIYTHRWSPTLGVSTLVAIASAASAVDLFRPPPARRPSGGVRSLP
jgi:hypothetical protein